MPSYTQYMRQMAVMDANDDDIESWITVRGNHIPIKKGQSKEDAVKSFIAGKKKNLVENHNSLVEAMNLEEKGYFKKDPRKRESITQSAIEMGKEEKNLEELMEFGVKEGNAANPESEKKVDNSAKKGKVFTSVMNKVRNFKAKEDGTYDYATGKPKDYSNGFSVSFHQNEPDEKGNWKSDYGRYSESEYDDNAKKLVEETNGELNIGYFSGTPEVSVWVKDFATAVKMAKKYNQHSIWNWKKGKVWINPSYDPKKNPMKQ